MVIQVGEKVHIVTRRLFEGDLRRHFAGIVEEVSEPLIRVSGHVFVFDEGANEFVRRDEERHRLFSTADSGHIINILPETTDMTKLRYEINRQGQRILTDGGSFSLNISEFSARR